MPAEPVTHSALAVIPLLAPNLDDPDWLTLDALLPPSPPRGEGRVRGEAHARVTELSEASSVPFLQVANGAERPLLLLDGEELIGAKQNRILNTTVLVAAHTEVTIPVSELRGAGALGLPRPPAPPGRRLALRLPPREEGGLGEPVGARGAGTEPTRADKNLI